MQPTGVDQLWIVPAHKNLIGANIELVEAEGREFRLREAINTLRERFQFIVLDCPPALDLLTLNALVAADTVLIPMQAEYFALEGISELLDTVERIRSGLNPSLEIEGVVLTMFDERTNLAQQVTAELKRFFGPKLCTTTIPRNIRLAEAPSHGKPALVYDIRSKGAESYIRLAKEIIARSLPVSEEAAPTEVAVAEEPERLRWSGRKRRSQRRSWISRLRSICVYIHSGRYMCNLPDRAGPPASLGMTTRCRPRRKGVTRESRDYKSTRLRLIGSILERAYD